MPAGGGGGETGVSGQSVVSCLDVIDTLWPGNGHSAPVLKPPAMVVSQAGCH